MPAQQATKARRLKKSFVWSETDNELTIAIDGFRNDKGDMEYLTGEDMVLTTYHIESSSDKTIVLSNGFETITLNAYKKR